LQHIVKDEVFLPHVYIYQFDPWSVLNAVWNEVTESKEEIAKDVDTATVTYCKVCQGFVMENRGKLRKNSASIHIKIHKPCIMTNTFL
jgi:hypothetical protein